MKNVDRMKLEYSPDSDAIYIYLSRKRRSYRTQEIAWEPSFRLVDYGADGAPIGIEILGTKDGIDISGLPRAAEVSALLEAHGFRVLAPQQQS